MPKKLLLFYIISLVLAGIILTVPNSLAQTYSSKNMTVTVKKHPADTNSKRVNITITKVTPKPKIHDGKTIIYKPQMYPVPTRVVHEKKVTVVRKTPAPRVTVNIRNINRQSQAQAQSQSSAQPGQSYMPFSNSYGYPNSYMYSYPNYMYGNNGSSHGYYPNNGYSYPAYNGNYSYPYNYGYNPSAYYYGNQTYPYYTGGNGYDNMTYPYYTRMGAGYDNMTYPYYTKMGTGYDAMTYPYYTKTGTGYDAMTNPYYTEGNAGATATAASAAAAPAGVAPYYAPANTPTYPATGKGTYSYNYPTRLPVTGTLDGLLLTAFASGTVILAYMLVRARGRKKQTKYQLLT